MNAFRRAAVLAASVSLAFAAPVMAQSNPMIGGEYLEVAAISIDDGHFLDYANHLAGIWRAQQEYAKAQGWISGYEVLNNVNPRHGEPDVILVTRFKSFADPAEEDRRNKQYSDHVKQTETQMQAASGERAKYRKVLSSQLWQVLNFRK
jgi:hypothetical protein